MNLQDSVMHTHFFPSFAYVELDPQPRFIFMTLFYTTDDVRVLRP
jgi:hypothetical protein